MNGLMAPGLDERFNAVLLRIQSRVLFPLEISSAFRSGDTGCHAKGLAVDIACTESRRRFHIVRCAILEGISRIGVYPDHIHIDVCQEGFADQVLWIGDYNASSKNGS